eukprot:CAMPEP_0198309520 /NCGR_PEP_ID=MMETSP1450-20131203/1898_1 /TAXON_ID=753684 ORGANISM="Madagascaria erythrocladiodes, Strain CCMP3234" /NCGR_SAMPLE_ID=MMETSP1450 /ASSEMBLY_ACC=CAM_ASM_001115 /LENGTH=80 /DNA_ID=CAMNT_0044012279 /DNA_START=98 /DNA_END=340 /DNA_ORIENTATION=+
MRWRVPRGFASSEQGFATPWHQPWALIGVASFLTLSLLWRQERKAAAEHDELPMRLEARSAVLARRRRRRLAPADADDGS